MDGERDRDRAADAADRPTPDGWTLPLVGRDRIVQDLLGAGRIGETTALVTDLRWVHRRLADRGVDVVLTELARGGAGSPVAEALALRLEQNADLLEPADPPAALGAILVSRLDGFAELQPVVDAYRPHLATPYLANRRPLPDQHAALRRAFVVQEIEQGAVRGLVVAPDGSWLVTLDTGWQDGRVGRWEVATGRRLDTIGSQLWPPFALSAGTSLLACGAGSTVQLVDLSTGATRHSWEATETFTAVVLAPDGTWLATGDPDGTVGVWDTATGARRRAFPAHADPVTAVAASTDGTLLATGDQAGVITIWDTTTWARRRTLPAQPGEVHALAFAPDRSWIAVGHGNGGGIWDLRTGEPRHTLDGHPDAVRALVVAPDGTWLATATGLSGRKREQRRRRCTDIVRIWDSVTGEQRNALPGPDAVELGVSPDGAWVAVGNVNSEVRVLDPTVVDGRPADPADVRPSAVAPDGSWYAAPIIDSGTIEIRDTGTDRVLRTIATPTQTVYAIRISRDARWLVTTGYERAVRVWDPYTGELHHTFTGVGFNPAIAVGTSWLVAGREDSPMRVWDLATGTERYAVTVPEQIGGLTVTPDESAIIVHCGPLGTGVVAIWDAATGTLRHELGGHRGNVPAVAVAPDGCRLATCQASGTFRIWNMATGARLHTLEPDGGLPPYVVLAADVAFSPDGRWLAGTYNIWSERRRSWRGAVAVWQAETGRAATLMRLGVEAGPCLWTPTGDGLRVHGHQHVFAFTFTTAHQATTCAPGDRRSTPPPAQSAQPPA